MPFKSRFGKVHKGLLIAALSLLAFAIFWQSEPSSAVLLPTKKFVPTPVESDTEAQASSQATPADPMQSAEKPSIPAVPEQQKPLPVSYDIQKGDNLSAIFEAHDIPVGTLHKLLQADAEYLALETLQPGTALRFRFNNKGQLQRLALQIDPARTVTYDRLDDGQFEYNLNTLPTHWEASVVRGNIQGSFYTSGLAAGLSKGQVIQIGQLLKSKLDFRRDLRAGDTFEVLVGREMTTTGPTGNTRVEAISLHRGRHDYNAFLYSDSNYYDENGESVTPAFLRYPTARHYRVTSPFNLNRLHPITGRRAPHNGVDLAAPSGTPVMSTGDGIVKLIGNHPYAGKYIEIDHSGAFSTRYLHLSRILVKRGETVKRGERIALSGNTGRTTGPHLHFELRVNHQPVNPLTADIPTSTKVPANTLSKFESTVREKLAKMRVPAVMGQDYAQALSGSVSPTGQWPASWTEHCTRPGQCRYQ